MAEMTEKESGISFGMTKFRAVRKSFVKGKQHVGDHIQKDYLILRR